MQARSRRGAPPVRLIALGLLSACLLAACANRPQPLYYWGSYQAQVYSHFKGDGSAEEQILALEKDMARAAAEGRTLPPGFHAHLAMLYGNTGRTDQMASHLALEKQRFPESGTFMDFLLKKFERPATDAR